jgi:hypothetical protein
VDYTNATEVVSKIQDYFRKFPNLFFNTGDPSITHSSNVFLSEDDFPIKIEPVYSEDEFVEGAGLVENYHAICNLQISANSSIVEVPYGSVTTAVADRPPLKPEVNIVPYRSVNDQILINFSSTFGTNLELPIAIEPEDQDIINTYEVEASGFVKYVTGATIENGHVTGYDDFPAHVEVYRTTEKPQSYSDFAGKLRHKISTHLSDKPNVIRNLSPSIVDKISPNVKYYYTFRYVDFHGSLSNPTSIYEVEMIDDGGNVYPIIGSYNFPSTAKVDSSKKLKKLLLIRPNLQQGSLTTEDNGVQNDWGEALAGTAPTPDDLSTTALGGGLYDENALWGKKFKFRITSTESGKKIDLNVNFKTKTEDQE